MHIYFNCVLIVYIDTIKTQLKDIYSHITKVFVRVTLI